MSPSDNAVDSSTEILPPDIIAPKTLQIIITIVAPATGVLVFTLCVILCLSVFIHRRRRKKRLRNRNKAGESKFYHTINATKSKPPTNTGIAQAKGGKQVQQPNNKKTINVAKGGSNQQKTADKPHPIKKKAVNEPTCPLVYMVLDYVRSW